MKTFLFDLTSLWDDVLDFFHELYEDTDEDGESYSSSHDVMLVALCWLSQRLYEKGGIVNLEAEEINLPFEMELMVYQDSDTLLNSDFRLYKFDKYLDIINFNSYLSSNSVVIRVINKIMVINET